MFKLVSIAKNLTGATIRQVSVLGLKFFFVNLLQNVIVDSKNKKLEKFSIKQSF